jgi:hypothetical protein
LRHKRKNQVEDIEPVGGAGQSEGDQDPEADPLR